MCYKTIYLDLNHLSQTEYQIVYHNILLVDLSQDYIQKDKFPIETYDAYVKPLSSLVKPIQIPQIYFLHKT